jgi:hypothetical protein
MRIELNEVVGEESYPVVIAIEDVPSPGQSTHFVVLGKRVNIELRMEGLEGSMSLPTGLLTPQQARDLAMKLMNAVAPLDIGD